jgi:isoamyl acetate esterase
MPPSCQERIANACFTKPLRMSTSLSKTTTSFRVRPAVLLLGDSLTQEGFGPGGWASRLTGAYTRRADVLNRGYSGYNTTMYLDILPRILGSTKDEDSNDGESALRGTSGAVDVLFCTVFLGANDAALPGEPQHVPIDQYRQNLQRIVQDVRRATSTTPTGSMDDSMRANAFPIVLCAPPPVEERVGRDIWKFPIRTGPTDERDRTGAASSRWPTA